MQTVLYFASLDIIFFKKRFKKLKSVLKSVLKSEELTSTILPMLAMCGLDSLTTESVSTYK